MTVPVEGIEWLRHIRRDLHSHPEPAWCEFYTTTKIVEELEGLGFNINDDADPFDNESGHTQRLYIGPDVLADGHRKAVPDESELEAWYERAKDRTDRTDVLDRLLGGYTGAIAVVQNGPGPTIALRVDIDALPQLESKDPDHRPMAEGFRSTNEGTMHACGHDAHTAIGLGVLRTVRETDFQGTLKVLFQPAEERGAGGKPMAESGHLNDVDYLLAVHVGLDLETGTVVPQISSFLAIRSFQSEFQGRSAHAGLEPEQGSNAIQTMGTAIENLYAIPRHSSGTTRINVGRANGGTASNIIAENASLEGEVRAESGSLIAYMEKRVQDVLYAAAEMHDCSVEVEFQEGTPSVECDETLVDRVRAVAQNCHGVDSIGSIDRPLWSEDATHLMRHVQRNGGLATYVGVGAGNQYGHHTPRFDIHEKSIPIAVNVLSETVNALAKEDREG